MKAELIKELHAVGVYRDPKTKVKLESMKVAEVLAVLEWVKDEMSNGAVFERKQCEYEFVKAGKKKEKLMGKGKKR